MITIYHKPNCSTSLETLRLLKNKNKDIQIIHYLETPPSANELKILLKKLGMKAEELVRKKEPLFKEKFADKKYSETQWIKIMISNPILIERPIVVKGDKAVLGRPPENALKL